MSALNLNVNLAAFRASNRSQSHYQRISQSVHRLSSGTRLNTSADSPVDMAVHNVHNGRVATLEKGRQNIHDAISLVQTAESAMARIDELLIKMKEIAANSATGTITDTQRMILSSEFGQLAAEIDRISKATEFKGIKLLDGSLSSMDSQKRLGSFYTATTQRNLTENTDPATKGLKVHFGVNNERLEDYYFINIGDLSLKGLLKDVGDPNLSAEEKISIDSQHQAQETLDTINSAMIAKESNRYVMGIMQNRLEATLRYQEDEIMFINNVNSILSDVDFANEVTVFTKAQMMMEASTAMLAQANILPKLALKLLNF